MLLDVEITYLILWSVAGEELNEHTDFFPSHSVHILILINANAIGASILPFICFWKTDS